MNWVITVTNSIRLQSNMMWTGQLRTDPSQNNIDKLAPEPMQVTYPSPFATNLTYIEVRNIDSQKSNTFPERLIWTKIIEKHTTIQRN